MTPLGGPLGPVFDTLLALPGYQCCAYRYRYAVNTNLEPFSSLSSDTLSIMDQWAVHNRYREYRCTNGIIDTLVDGY